MGEFSAIMQSALKRLAPQSQADLLSHLGISNEIEASPAGAILMGMYADYVGFPRYVDELLDL